MTKIINIDDFEKLTSNITGFSHAYLFNVNSLERSYFYIKEFAKKIIINDNKKLKKSDSDLISYQIDNDEYDDLYIINPTTININTDEINKLLANMKTKSLHLDGKRVYIIYGFERLSNAVSNKLLKFLEEPNDNIYGILMTENIDRILPTIISRCQIINLTIENNKIEIEKLQLMNEFLIKLIQKKQKMICEEYNYFIIQDRIDSYEKFEILEKIISATINYKYGFTEDNTLICEKLLEYSNFTLINSLNITNRLKCLIKGNINLNLLLDRYIIEMTEELDLCKKL